MADELDVDGYRALIAEVTAQLAVLQFNLGATLAAAGRFDEAAQAYQDALAARPGWSLALGNLGAVRHLQGRAADAVAAFEAAVAAAPDDAAGRCNLAAALCTTAAFADAEVQFRAALALAPGLERATDGLAAAMAGLGAALTAARHLVDAADVYRRARDLAPERFEGHFNWALAVEALGDHAAAIEGYRAALARAPGHLPSLNNLARALLALERTDELLAVYQHLRAVAPDHPKVAHLIAAARGELTAAAPRGYVISEFDGLAPRFEAVVRGLGYRAPERVGELVAAARARGPRLGAALDLGCGTGLTGVALREHVEVLHGVDLAPAMVEQAAAKGVYDALFVAELVEHLVREAGLAHYDLITATDVLIYLGDLRPVFAAIRRRLAPGGRLIATVEIAEGADVQLLPTGRYAHAQPYLERLAATHDLAVVAIERGELRREASAILPGLTVTLRAVER